ncbi:hypothetical protein N9X63_04015 [Woeseiaceae bacterium]|nr:hypothetical protein [Woeseiaceae bacterium]
MFKKFLHFIIIPFLVTSCVESSDYLTIQEKNPNLVVDRIYDCREQNRTLWSTTHSEVIAHIINLTKGYEVLHKSSYKDKILNSPWDYQLKDIETDDHYFSVLFYDLTITEETPIYIRFTIRGEGNKSNNYILNKSELTLKPNDVIERVMSNEKILDSFKSVFIDMNSWTRPCKKIGLLHNFS